MLELLFRLLFGPDQGPAIDPNGGRGGLDAETSVQASLRRRPGPDDRSRRPRRLKMLKLFFVMFFDGDRGAGLDPNG